MPRPSERISVNAQWLIRLRWVAIFGQLATIVTVVALLGIKLDALWALQIVISLTAVSNLMLNIWFLRWSANENRSPLKWDLILGLVMVLDMLSLTALLYATGGPNNPFALFFFVNLSLCAIVLNRNWAWMLNVISIFCFALLLFDHYQVDQLNMGIDMQPIRVRGGISLLQFGLWVAFATSTSVIVYFMTRLTDELRIQQLEVRKAQVQQARSEKLEALGTLAAGTAHELATPLSTIAVVARDVEKAFDEHPPDFPGAEDVIDDVHLIRSQLDRCRGILDRMASHSGQAIGESIQPISINGLIETILSDMPDRERVVVEVSPNLADQMVKVPIVGLSQALRGFIQNAIDADQKGSPVKLEAEKTENEWQLVIRDFGPGMPGEVLDRVSEPFFTTKAPGKGMGLGVFLATNVIKRLGGRLDIQSAPQRGTRVTVWLPLEMK